MFIIGLTNYFIDPYGLFNNPFPGFNTVKPTKYRSRKNWAEMTINIIKNSDYNTIFLGSSRTHVGLDPSYLLPEYKAYNASNNGGNIENYFTVLYPIIKHNPKIKTIVLGIDFGSECKPNTLLFNSFKPKKILNNLFGYYSTQDAFTTVKYNLLKQKTTNNYEENGYHSLKHFIKTESDYRQDLERTLNIYEHNLNVTKSYAYGWKYLYSIVQLCNEHGINLILYIPPIHSDLYEAIIQNDMYYDYENWMRTVTDISYKTQDSLSTNNNIEVWNFSGYNTITTEPFPASGDNTMRKWYYESSHFKKEVGDMILDKIFETEYRNPLIPEDFGTLITNENIEEHLKALRQRRIDYLNKNE